MTPLVAPEGIAVGRRPTDYGLLSYACRQTGREAILVIRAGLNWLAGGVVIATPPGSRLVQARADGKRIGTPAGELRLTQPTSQVVLTYAS